MITTITLGILFSSMFLFGIANGSKRKVSK